MLDVFRPVGTDVQAPAAHAWHWRRICGRFAAVVTLVVVGCCSAAAYAQESPAPQDAATAESASGAGQDANPVRIPTDFVAVIDLMGLWMVPYVIASVIGVWFSLERLVVLRRGRVIPSKFVHPFLENLRAGKLDQSAALAICEKQDSPIAALFAHGIRKWGRPSLEVEQAIIDGSERQITKLRKHIRALNTISVIMPMVGLLGTVVGMIQAFNDIASAGAMGNAELLAASIAIALLTTAFGLGVAVPALTMYIYLGGRVEAIVAEMDELAQQVAYAVSAEGLQARPATPAPIPRPRMKKAVAEETAPVTP